MPVVDFRPLWHLAPVVTAVLPPVVVWAAYVCAILAVTFQVEIALVAKGVAQALIASKIAVVGNVDRKSVV